MIQIHTKKQNEVLEELQKTLGDFELCSPENLARLRAPKIFPISNKNRFYNERAYEILKTWHDINAVFHYFPRTYQKKMIASREFENLFLTQILSPLERELRDLEQKGKKKKTLTEEEEKNVLLLLKLYSKFFNIGLSGIEKLVPYEFQQILHDQIEPIKNLMRGIDSYTKRISSEKIISSKFPFEEHEIGL